MQLNNLQQIFNLLDGKPKRNLVAAWAVDSHTIKAAAEAVEMGFTEATLVGDETLILDECKKHNLDPGIFNIVHESTENSAAVRSVRLINDQQGNLLMKGNLSTDKYMRAILDKEYGLMDRGAILSHVTVIKIADYHKLLIIGDVAIIPLPDLKQKIAIANYLIRTAHALGIEQPKLALLAATEQVMPGMPACMDAAIISKMSERGQIRGALVDGPLSMDLITSMDSVKIKGVISNVAGDADCILFPNIEAGNVFYKINAQHGNSEQAAIIAGARVPAVLSSRGDSASTKLYSIALAAMLAN